MLMLLNNIEEDFFKIDKAFKIFNDEVKALPTQANIIKKLPTLNDSISQYLRNIKINMAAFDFALKTQEIVKTNHSDITAIEESKVIVENTLVGLIKNIEQLKKAEKTTPLNTGIIALVKNTEEWKFLLEKHLEQYEVILNSLRK